MKFFLQFRSDYFDKEGKFFLLCRNKAGMRHNPSTIPSRFGHPLFHNPQNFPLRAIPASGRAPSWPADRTPLPGDIPPAQPQISPPPPGAPQSGSGAQRRVPGSPLLSGACSMFPKGGLPPEKQKALRDAKDRKRLYLQSGFFHGTLIAVFIVAFSV